tara:strand:+ start:205 stop:402 length:198 start_codon:yes stop_codon:yes gene_type:complete
MKPGDLVEIWKRAHWGGMFQTGRKGLVVKRSYLGYDRESTRWEVFEKGKVKIMMERNLKVINESG